MGLAVLRPAPLRDIEAAHDLDARHDRLRVRGWDRQGRPASTVDAVSHAGLLALAGLDMDVRGAELVGFSDDAIHELDYGGGILVDGVLFDFHDRLDRLILQLSDELVDIGCRLVGARALAEVAPDVVGQPDLEYI